MRLHFPKIEEISRIEQDRRTLQEGLERAQRIVDETVALIADAEARSAPALLEDESEAGDQQRD